MKQAQARGLPVDWQDAQAEATEQIAYYSLKPVGLRVFTLKTLYPPMEKTLKYTNASKDYLESINKTADDITSIWVRRFTIMPILWVSKPYTGKQVLTEMSEKVWQNLIELSLILKHMGYIQGQYIVYWKVSRVMVKLAFMTEAQYQYNKCVLDGFDPKDASKVDSMNRRIYWFAPQLRFDKQAFDDFYSGKV